MAKRVVLIEGDSTDSNTLAKVKAEIPVGGSVMVVLDSDHSRDHVLAELRSYGPLVTTGYYLVVADTILGTPRAAHYEGIPRVVFADPEIAAVGMTAAQALDAGIEVASTEVNLPEAITRPWTYETDPQGTLGLLADQRRKVLIGAWAVAPMASEWIHQAALATRAQIPLGILRDHVPQFPTYSEAYLAVLERLDA